MQVHVMKAMGAADVVADGNDRRRNQVECETCVNQLPSPVFGKIILSRHSKRYQHRNGGKTRFGHIG